MNGVRMWVFEYVDNLSDLSSPIMSLTDWMLTLTTPVNNCQTLCVDDLLHGPLARLCQLLADYACLPLAKMAHANFTRFLRLSRNLWRCPPTSTLLIAHEKKIGHRELTVSSRRPKWSQPAVTWAVIELWPSRDWAVIILKMLWLSCDRLAVTELWPSRDWAVTSPWLSCDLS